MTDLQRLATWLSLSEEASEKTPPRLEAFAAWKPLAERAVRDQAAHAQEMADCIVRLGQANEDWHCLALAHWTRANVLYLLDLPMAALEDYDQAERLYRAHGEELQTARLGSGKVGVLSELGRYDEAITVGTTALNTLEAPTVEPDHSFIGNLCGEIGIAYEFQGRYLEALKYYQRKLRLCEQAQSEVRIARALVNIGVVKTHLGLYVEALHALQRARHLFEQAQPITPTQGDIARVDMNVAWLEALRDSPSVVVQAAFAHARHSRAQMGENSTDLILLDLDEAEWKLSHNDWDAQAQRALQIARDRCNQVGLAHETQRAEWLLAHATLQQGDAQAACAAFGRIVTTGQRNADAQLIYRGLLGQAQAYRSLGQPQLAQNVLNQAIAHTESLRASLNIEEFRAGFIHDRLRAFRELAALQLETHAAEEALATLERAKSRVLLDLLSGSSSKAQKPKAPSSELTEAQKHLAALRETLRRGRTTLPPVEQQLLEQRIKDASRELQWVEGRLIANQSAQTKSLAEICLALPEDTAMLVYGLLPTQVVGFALNQHGLIGKPFSLGALPAEDDLRQGLTKIGHVGRVPVSSAHRWAEQHIATAQSVLGQWHEQWIAPMAEVLSSYRRIVIVPDGLLNALPFACMFDAAKRRYLIESHEVSMAPSMSVWGWLRQQPEHASSQGRLVAVGYSSGGWLPHAVLEAKQVASMFQDAQFLSEGEATRAAVSKAAEQCSLLYLATHGVFRADAPLHSYVECADGLWEAADVIRLHMQAQLTVLGACESGVGSLTGNEMLGLVHSFLAAGSQAVIATLWRTLDEATHDFMVHLMRQLCSGLPVTTALAQTQRAMIHGDIALYQHPFVWGGVTLFGTGLNPYTTGNAC